MDQEVSISISTIKILGMAGSLRKGSYNRAILQAATELVPENSQLEVFDRLGEIPLYNQDNENNPPNVVTEFKEKIREADAILFATPEYNYSIPGVLKNAIDWASRPYGDSAWDGKPVAIMGASGGMLGGSRAQYHLRQVFVFLNMKPLNQPEVIIPHVNEKVSEHGKVTDEHTLEKIKEILDSLIQWTIELQIGEKLAEEFTEREEYEGAYGRLSNFEERPN